MPHVAEGRWCASHRGITSRDGCPRQRASMESTCRTCRPPKTTTCLLQSDQNVRAVKDHVRRYMARGCWGGPAWGGVFSGWRAFTCLTGWGERWMRGCHTYRPWVSFRVQIPYCPKHPGQPTPTPVSAPCNKRQLRHMIQQRSCRCPAPPSSLCYIYIPCMPPP